MKSSEDLLNAALIAISANKELIYDAYTRGSIVRTGENARGVFLLHQHRILVTDGHESYRLSRFLTKFFDEVTQKQRLYELLGENVGALIGQVMLLKDEYARAIMESRTDEADGVSAQFHDACAELSDSITSGISKLLAQTENNFAAVTTIAAKQRQNNHYIKQAERISDSLRSLAQLDIQQSLDNGSAFYKTLSPFYRVFVSDRMGEWDSELVRVTAILKEYLFKLRMIEPDVKRLREFATFLKQNLGYTPPNFDDNQKPPSWLMRDPGIRPFAYTDLSNAEIREDLITIARGLPAPKVIPKMEKEAGSLLRTADMAQQVKIIPKQYHVALNRFATLAYRSAEPLSAIKWKRDVCKDIDLPDELWLMLVMNSQELGRWPYSNLSYHRIEHRGEAPISMNLYIQDVLVHGR